MIAWSTIGSGAIDFLKIAWKPLAMGAGAILLAQFVWYGPRIDNLKMEIRLKESTIERLESVIESQNEAIENASEESRETFEEMLEDIRNSIEAGDRDTANTIRNIIEAGMPEGCTESTTYLLEQIDNLQWEKPDD